MKRTFSGRIFLVCFSIVFVLEISNILIVNYILKSQSTKMLSQSMRNIALTVEPSLKKSITQKNLQEIEKIFKEITNKTDVRITLIDEKGSIIADSQTQTKTMENHSDRPEFRKAMERGEGDSIRWSPTLDRYFYYYALKIDKPSMVLRVSVSTDRIKEINSILFRQFFLITLGLFLLGIITSIVAARILTYPVKEILKLSEEASAGLSENKGVVKETDEIGKIIENINNLGLVIRRMVKEKELREIEIERFLNLIDVPFTIITQQGNIVFASKKFEEISRMEKKHNLWWEKIRVFEINEIINKTFENKDGVQEEIIIEDSYFLCKTSFLQDGVILVMFDMSGIRKMEKARKDFVIATSHELKTPLTAIKGYTETLQDEIKDPQQKEFIEIINHNISRLEKIVEDLINLSQIEDNDAKLVLETVDIKKIVENVVSLYMKKAREKGIEFKINIQDLPLIKADGFRIEQMLVNLIDNSVRYTEKGEISICISYQKDSATIKIEITDTGIGIPHQHLPRIFERFYVVDKARSRQTGGTGLGLSIVKHIVLLHNGTIDVESEENKGTKFTIHLPLKI
ncbi:MAG TPA: ATP-binding protein [bacterium]|jgi:two-component system phosphate regulon sensor histidine kinase PhoR|nr:ATP-binding protein [bacterium]HPC28859.1 ATP-binding protein [bacterium]HQL64246.1 ATP-binding protein [bacterium]HRV04638.1 ATP-binding protein [Candidatus Ratteibacteria bacterium]